MADVPDITPEEAEAVKNALTPRDWGTRRWKGPFLEVLAQTGNASAAAKRVGRARTYCQDERTDDPEFGKAWLEAMQVHGDLLDQIAWRRGTVGEPRTVTTTKTTRNGEGEVVETVQTVTESTRYSDRMLELQLRGLRPDKYGDQIRHVGPEGGPIQVEVGPRERSTERLAELYEIALREGWIQPRPALSEGNGA